MSNIRALALIAPDGCRRDVLAYLPTDEVRQEYYDKAHKCGLVVEEIMNCEL